MHASVHEALLTTEVQVHHWKSHVPHGQQTPIKEEQDPKNCEKEAKRREANSNFCKGKRD